MKWQSGEAISNLKFKIFKKWLHTKGIKKKTETTNSHEITRIKKENPPAFGHPSLNFGFGISDVGFAGNSS